MLLLLIIFTAAISFINPPLVDKYVESAPTIALVSPYEHPPKKKHTMWDLLFPEKGGFGAIYRKGSAVFVRGDGVLLTAAHVVKGTSLVRLETNDSRVYRAVVSARDEKLDIALLKIDHPQERFRAARIGAERPLGWPVYAIGNPAWFKAAITAGIIAAYDYEDRRLISDAFVEHGSSGGGLFDATDGRLIGIVVQLYKGYSASIQTSALQAFLDHTLLLAGDQ